MSSQDASIGPEVSSSPTMFLLRYGIRCIMHYSVPVTLGLLAWNGSWQNVSRQILSESAGKSGNASSKASETVASKNPESTRPGSGANGEIPNPERQGSDSIAMNPAGDDSKPRGLTIPRADSRGRNETAAATNDGQGFPHQSETDSNRAPRDRNIDATGHETPILAAATASGPEAAPAAAKESVEKTPSAATIAAAEKAPAANPDTAHQTADPAAKQQKVEIAENSPPKTADVAAAAVAGAAVAAETRERSDTARGKESKLVESAQDTDQGIEPADLKPEVRAIAAEVPRSGNESKPESGPATEKTIASASGLTRPEPNQPVEEPPRPERPQVASSDPAIAGSKTVSVKTANRGSEPNPNAAEQKEPIAVRKPDVVPDIVVAENGESWRRIAERVYGDEKMAEAIWKENRDAHGGSSDSLPVAGRLVRLPSISPRGGIRKAGTQLARTAR